ncbi:hypothetical protein [Sanguibacter sp. HDW7]|uniref:hypothetical protein n=1 Tax=Sanguibacter sp. HDW7 TaxID=2714931 RepID=UPI00140BFD0B|nr:hypothetical protein [Sanguibacter sp. HDW7]QIK83760.1 hypothetical protein G7063_09070 [Sanguibacter sp. HDW7]
MALFPKFRKIFQRPDPVSRVGARRPTSATPAGDEAREDTLRARLAEDPNDVEAFRALADLVRRRADGPHPAEDPLTPADDAETAEQERARRGDLAVWSLAEELAGHPRAWYPLVELARLSVGEDHEQAVRRLVNAHERDPEGHALAHGLGVLRDAGRPAEALSLGTGHWRAREHDPEVGRHLVLSALEAGRPDEAERHLSAIDLHPDQKKVAELRGELRAALDAAADHTQA